MQGRSSGYAGAGQWALEEWPPASSPRCRLDRGYSVSEEALLKIAVQPHHTVLPFCQNGGAVTALIRERSEAVPRRRSRSVYEITVDLTGSVAGSRKPATNERQIAICDTRPLLEYLNLNDPYRGLQKMVIA